MLTATDQVGDDRAVPLIGQRCTSPQSPRPALHGAVALVSVLLVLLVEALHSFPFDLGRR